MKPNLWSTMFAARRRAIDRALLASLEREIAQTEKAAAAEAKKHPAPVISDEERFRISRAFGRPH